MDRTPDTEFCARLKCVADVSEDKSSVQSIIGLKIFKTALTNKLFKLASVSLFDSSPHLELTRSHVLDVTGEVTRLHGDLNLGFRDESDCLYGSFLCELNFINTTGQPLVVSEESTPQRENLGQMLQGQSRAIPRLKILLWNSVEALCDTQTDGGGWIIFQRRTTGTVNFYRNWTDYKTGFGDIKTDYWLGNDAISNLTSLGYNELRVDLRKDHRRYFAHYSDFSVADENLKYRLSVSGYTGNAGNGLEPHNTMYFSTYDRDNDKCSESCAILYTGAWWYYNDYESHLNGYWGATNYSGLYWKGAIEKPSAEYTEMKIRQG